jgi:two-component system response regulator FlrC
MLSHDWPGNVRELDNVIQRAMILKSGRCIEAENIYFELCGRLSASDSNDSAFQDVKVSTLDHDLKSREQELIIDALMTGNGSRKEAAALLGISPRTLRYKLARLREQGVAIPG